MTIIRKMWRKKLLWVLVLIIVSTRISGEPVYKKKILLQVNWGKEESQLGYCPEERDKEGFLNPAEVPRSFAIDKDENIYITDTVKKRVVKFSKEGKLLLAFGENILKQPIDVAVAGNGDIYVLDLTSFLSLYKWDSTGSIREQVISEKQGECVWGIKSGEGGSIYINYTPVGKNLSKYLKLDQNGIAVGEVETYWVNNRNVFLRRQSTVFLLLQNRKVFKRINLENIVKGIGEFTTKGFDDKNSIYLIKTHSINKTEEKILKIRGNKIVATIDVSPNIPSVGLARSGIIVLLNGDIYQMQILETALRIIKFELQ